MKAKFASQISNRLYLIEISHQIFFSAIWLLTISPKSILEDMKNIGIDKLIEGADIVRLIN